MRVEVNVNPWLRKLFEVTQYTLKDWQHFIDCAKTANFTATLYPLRCYLKRLKAVLVLYNCCLVVGSEPALPHPSRHILAGAAAALFVKSDTFNVVLHISVKVAVELCRALNSGVIRVPAGDDRAYRCKEWDLIITVQVGLVPHSGSCPTLTKTTRPSYLFQHLITQQP
jgi:hypothetical protein